MKNFQYYVVGDAAADAVGAPLGRLVGATLSQRPNLTLRQRRLPTSRRPCWLRWANVFSTELCYRGRLNIGEIMQSIDKFYDDK